jgi:glycosidase
MRDAFGSGKPVQAVANVIGHDYLYPRPAALIPFLANHDTPRFMNDEGSTIAGLKLAFTCLLTLRGIPLIYYGDEIAMSGGGDPDNRRDFPGGWHDDPANAFTKAGRTPDQEEVFEHVKKLTALRASDAALRHGELKTLVTTQQQWVYARRSGSHTVVVAINNDKTPAVITIPLSGMTLADGTNLRGALGAVAKATVQSGQITVSLPARTAEVFVSR